MVSKCTWAALALYALLAISESRAEEIVDDPNAAVEGIYSECVMGMSWACLQRKALMFINRMGKSEKFPLVGDGVISLIRTAPPEPEVNEESLRGLDSNSLGDLVDNTISKFFETHIFRFELPSWLKGGDDETERADNAIDFYVGDGVEEGRKKGGLGGGGGGGGKKGMKKMMMMMCMMAAGKMMMLGPLMMGMTKMIAMKALIMGVISLTISKIMILKKLKMKQGGGSSSGWSSGGGGGGGGWSSGGGGGSGGWSSGGGGGGGGGWDRSFPAHDLAYRSHIDDNSA